jgi:hypothetical protein
MYDLIMAQWSLQAVHWAAQSVICFTVKVTSILGLEGAGCE